MGFLDKLFGGGDPALRWEASPSVRIELDLDRPALCGIRLGDNSDRIAMLGRPDNPRPSKDEQYVYERHGFWIDACDRSICSFTVIFDATASELTGEAFSGTILDKNQPIELNASTDEAEFRRRFGEPYWRDVDEKECLLFYEFGQIEWQVEFGKGDGLRVLTIVTPPLLSGTEQRAAYHVGKPWPPA
jgi:hypothetical protein